MFKFARYFFIIFIVITLIPLFVMFFLHKQSIDRFILEKNSRLISAGFDSFKLRFKNYTTSEQKMIEDSINSSSGKSQLYKKFSNDKSILDASIVSGLKNYPKYYFEIRSLKDNSPELCIVYFVQSDKKSEVLKISKIFEVEKIKPEGPFQLFVDIKIDGKYRPFKKIDDEFHRMMHDRFPQTPPDHHRPPSFMQKNEVGKSINLLGADGSNIALIKIVTAPMPPPHLGHPGPGDEKIPGLRPALALILSGILLSVIVSLFINKSFVQPFFVISENFKKLSQGDLNTEIQSCSKQAEVQHMYDNFNNMVKELKEKEDLKNSFIENLTHDLRTPLIAQERALDLLIEEFKDDEQSQVSELSKGLRNNNTYLLNMVNLLLDSYRVDFEKRDFEPSNVKLSLIVKSSIDRIYALIKEKNIELLNDVDNSVFIYADEISLKRVFINLISNAVENNPINSKIQISTKAFSESVEVVIEDNGVGISQDELPYVFDKYYSGKTNTRKIGSGLGLYACKKLVEKNNGIIEIKSEEGKFTKFIIKLPKGNV